MLGLIPANLFALATNILIGVGISLSVIFIMLSGIQLMAAMGNEEKAKKARRAFVNSVVGLIVVLSAVSAVYVVGNTLGTDFSTTYLRSIIPF